MHRGTGDTHTTQVARSTRVSRGSLYVYFLSKENMLFFSLYQTQRFIRENNKKILLEYERDYWGMLETSLRYHFSICRIDRLYHLFYLPMEGNESFSPLSHSLLHGEEYMEYRAWTYRHLMPTYRERFSEDESGVYQDTCDDILAVSIQGYILGVGRKEDTIAYFHNKMVYVRPGVKQQTV